MAHECGGDRASGPIAQVGADEVAADALARLDSVDPDHRDAERASPSFAPRADFESIDAASAGTSPGSWSITASMAWWVPAPLVGSSIEKRALVCLRPDGLETVPEVVAALVDAAKRLGHAGWAVEDAANLPRLEAGDLRQWRVFLTANPPVLPPVGAALPFADNADRGGPDAVLAVWRSAHADRDPFPRHSSYPVHAYDLDHRARFLLGRPDRRRA